MILKEGKLYKMRALVGAVPQAPVIIFASSMDQADTETILHFADMPEHAGKEVRILSASEIAMDEI